MAKPKSLNASIREKAMNLLDTMSPAAVQKAMKAEFNAYKKKTGNFHKADDRHAMNSETTTKGTTDMMYGGMGKKKKMMGGGMSKKRPEMMKGGMANGKKHMYAAGGNVMDGLTPGQKKMVAAMARDNKKA